MNKVTLIGRLTKSPELKYAAGSGTPVSKFTLAVNRKKKKDEEKAEADFISCVVFGKTAETIAQHVIKGQQIAISGRIQTGSYDAQDGTKRYTTDVIVETFEFLGNKNRNSNDLPDDITPVDDEDTPF